MTFKCFFHGHDFKPLVFKKSIVNSIGQQIGMASYLMCTRCAKGMDVVTWSCDAEWIATTYAELEQK